MKHVDNSEENMHVDIEAQRVKKSRIKSMTVAYLISFKKQLKLVLLILATPITINLNIKF